MTARVFGLAALLLLPAAAAAAQDTPRFVAGGAAGVGRTWDDESLLGTGLVAEGRFGVNLTRKTQVEFVLTQIPFERRFDSGVGTDGRSINTALILKHDFTSGAVRPFLTAGYGINNFRGTRTTPEPFVSRTSTNDHGYVLGTGFVVDRGRWQIGPEARVYMLAIDQDSSGAMILTGTIRAGWRF